MTPIAPPEGSMDATTEFLSDYACRLTYEDLSPEAVHQVKRTLIDTLGCGAGAFDSEPASIARRLASRVQGDPPARILGTAQKTSTDLAAFANTVLVRYLDCNDTYAARGTGHPSDMIPAVLAVADGHRADGRAAITAIVVAYEAFCRLADTVPLKGWDQGMFVAIGAACGAGKILGLDRVEVGNAISIAITSGVPLGVTRIGELSMWKGCATAAAVRTGGFSAWLAAEGKKWDPAARETGDHGLPYLVARALADGGVTPATFLPTRFEEPALRPHIKKLEVLEEPEFTRRYPAESCTRIEVTTTDGRRVAAETSHPKGHYRNPLTDGEVEGKFRGLASGVLGAQGCDRVLREVWNFENAPTLDRLFESLVISRRRTSP